MYKTKEEATVILSQLKDRHKRLTRLIEVEMSRLDKEENKRKSFFNRLYTWIDKLNIFLKRFK